MTTGGLNLLGKYEECKTKIKEQILLGVKPVKVGFGLQPDFPIGIWSLNIFLKGWRGWLNLCFKMKANLWMSFGIKLTKINTMTLFKGKNCLDYFLQMKGVVGSGGGGRSRVFWIYYNVKKNCRISRGRHPLLPFTPSAGPSQHGHNSQNQKLQLMKNLDLGSICKHRLVRKWPAWVWVEPVGLGAVGEHLLETASVSAPHHCETTVEDRCKGGKTKVSRNICHLNSYQIYNFNSDFSFSRTGSPGAPQTRCQEVLGWSIPLE